MKNYCLVVLFVTLGFFACNQESGSLTVAEAWSFPVELSNESSEHVKDCCKSPVNGVVYLKIQNSSATNDRLLSANYEVCQKVEIHETKIVKGKASMEHLPNVSIPSGETVLLKPRGKHIMLLKLKQALVSGETFELTLNFEKAGAIKVQSKIRTL